MNVTLHYATPERWNIGLDQRHVLYFTSVITLNYPALHGLESPTTSKPNQPKCHRKKNTKNISKKK
jgi:hypothetical protein